MSNLRGGAFVDDFVQALTDKLGGRVDFLGAIDTSKGEQFKPEDWEETEREKGYRHTGYKRIEIK